MRWLGKSTTVLALWVFVVGTIVLVAVFSGWWLIFKPVLPHPFLAGLVAFLIAVAALLLARLLAEKFAERAQPGAPPIKLYYYLVYLFLFMVSAMGTVNAAFVLWEGSSVVRQDMAEVRNAYTALDVFAKQALTSRDHERRRRDLDSLLAQLHEEIVNPNDDFCGVGDAANAILTRIRAIVPRMPMIRGTGAIRPCDRAVAERLYQSYRASALATFAGDQAHLAFNGPRKEAFLRSLDQHIGAVRTSFEQMEGLLSDPTAFARAEIQQPLANAASNYNDDYQNLAGLAQSVDEAIPEAVDVSQSQELGSFAAFFEILASRLGDVKTWVYLIIAVLLDIGLVYFLTQAFIRYRRRGPGEVDTYRQRGGQHPKFLWENPATEPARREVRHV